MTNDDRRITDIQETTVLVPLDEKGRGYSFISPRRARKEVAVIVAPPPPPELPDDEDARKTRDFKPAVIEALLASRAPTVPLLPPKPEAYRDPELCSCAKMMTALSSKVVMVVWNGPVTLSPAVLREEMLLSGDVRLDGIERAYDGKPWAFRHCPFEGCLIDAQIAVVGQRDNMTCCGTMALAVERGRVLLSNPERFDQTMAKFTDPGRASVLFAYCPWCATEIIDLSIARHKRHRGL